MKSTVICVHHGQDSYRINLRMNGASMSSQLLSKSKDDFYYIVALTIICSDEC